MTAQDIAIEPLEWDSDFFGFPVARLTFHGKLTLDDAIAELRVAKTRRAYLDVDGDHTSLREKAEKLGGRFVGRRVELVTHQLDRLMPEGVEELSHNPDEADRRMVRSLALASGELSRFRIDPGITDQQFTALYDIWIENSMAEGHDQAVLVTRVAGTVGGMISISMKDGVGVIGLFAVHAAHRGRGLGSELLRGAVVWTAEHRGSAVQVTTQGENAGALAAYDSADFSIERISDTFHFWI